jgi:hypothetical protein
MNQARKFHPTALNLVFLKRPTHEAINSLTSESKFAFPGSYIPEATQRATLPCDELISSIELVVRGIEN